MSVQVPIQTDGALKLDHLRRVEFKKCQLKSTQGKGKPQWWCRIPNSNRDFCYLSSEGTLRQRAVRGAGGRGHDLCRGTTPSQLLQALFTNQSQQQNSEQGNPSNFTSGVQRRGAMALVGCGGANRRYLQVSEVYTFALSPGHLLDKSTVREWRLKVYL